MVATALIVALLASATALTNDNRTLQGVALFCLFLVGMVTPVSGVT